MSHTQSVELNKIPLGSGDVYVTLWQGYIPSDEYIEKEKNLIGRTKNGANIAYSTNYYKAVSDDGKARKTKFISDEASFGYGLITWNGLTLKRLISTARVESAVTAGNTSGRRRTKIGGAANDNGKQYLLRFVCRDLKDGDIRITVRGTNTGGWSAVFGNTETILQPKFECEPLDTEGTLIVYEEEEIESIVEIDLPETYPDIDVSDTESEDSETES
ncbi:MAG: hypothetical protein IJX77_06155 [Ruminococcus sp.]|nr:hypothetical protein [Ruminococcus sp.]